MGTNSHQRAWSVSAIVRKEAELYELMFVSKRVYDIGFSSFIIQNPDLYLRQCYLWRRFVYYMWCQISYDGCLFFYCV